MILIIMKYKYIIAAVLYMALIWFLSSRSGDAMHIPGDFDKLAHLAEYAVLAFLLARGFGRPFWWAAFLTATIWGVIDEWHQSWVPLRDASAWDIVADALGALVGMAAAVLPVRKAR